MKVYKRLTSWESETHGGEVRFHIDFSSEPGESLQQALIRMIESEFIAQFWSDKLPYYGKFHVTGSVFLDEFLINSSPEEV